LEILKHLVELAKENPLEEYVKKLKK